MEPSSPVSARVSPTPPDAGFSGAETISYTIQDTTETIATAVATVWVDTGPSGPQSPELATDYFYAYQGSALPFTTSQLLANDTDPQGQALTVVAISEPGSDGVVTGDLASGFVYTPAVDPAHVGFDQVLEYLGMDTDGHVQRTFVSIRILAAGDPNRPPVARDDVARTNTAPTVSVVTTGNDFDPDGDGFSVVSINTPAHGTVGQHRIRFQLHTQSRVLGGGEHHLHDPRQPRPHRQPDSPPCGSTPE